MDTTYKNPHASGTYILEGEERHKQLSNQNTYADRGEHRGSTSSEGDGDAGGELSFVLLVFLYRMLRTGLTARVTVQERPERGVRGHGESGTGSATLRFLGLLARALSGVKPNGNGCENGGCGDIKFLRVQEIDVEGPRQV